MVQGLGFPEYVELVDGYVEDVNRDAVLWRTKSFRAVWIPIGQLHEAHRADARQDLVGLEALTVSGFIAKRNNLI